MTTQRPWRLFHRTLFLFVGLGVTPLLIVALALALPIHLQVIQYQILVGLLLIGSTVSTLCLAGVVVKILKHPIEQLLIAQAEIKDGNLAYRLHPSGSHEMHQLFHGFNEMAEGLAIAAERERQLIEERSLTKLVSQVVHDLRSPLTSLAIACKYFVAKTDPDPEYAQYVNILNLSTQRFRNLAEELLQRRRDHTKQPPTLLHTAIEELITEFQGRHPNDLAFETRYHQPIIPLPLSKTEIQRLCGNIMTNAVEAMRGVGKISVWTDTECENITIHIQDNGPGMESHVLQKVLQGGFTYGKVNGNGVGMTVVREIVEKYHGRISAESMVGIGTSFRIDLPLHTTLPSA